MRRSARISAKKGLAVSAVRSQATEPVKTQEITAEKVISKKEPQRKARQTQRIGKTSKSSARKDIDPVEIVLNENDTFKNVGSIPEASLKELVSNTEDRLEICEGRETTRSESDDAVELNKNDVACEETKGENESQPCKSGHHQALQKKEQKPKEVKDKAEMRGACREQQEAVHAPSITDSINGSWEGKQVESESFMILSKKEIDLKKITGDIKTDRSGINEETNRSVLGIEGKGAKVRSRTINTGFNCKKADGLFDSRDRALPIVSQLNTQKRTLSKKHPRIQREGQFALSHASLQNNSSNRTLLKLTSEIFQKIPFKITKEDLLANKLPNRNGSKSTFTNYDSKNSVDEDVLQKDVISVTLDDKEMTDMKKKPLALSSELDPRVEANELYFKLGKNGTAPTSRETEISSREKEGNILKKSVIGPDFEQKEHSCAHESNAQKMKKYKQKAKETAGKGWYNLPKTEMTDEVKRDIQIIKMRSVLDPKRFYKRGDKRISKYDFLPLTCILKLKKARIIGA